MYISELPEGSVIEINGKRVELTESLRFSDGDDVMTKNQASAYQDQDIKIISVPYEVALKLAEWLDNVYTKKGQPESLIIEAAEDAKKTKHDTHISNLPKKLGDAVTIRTISVANRDDADSVLRGVEEIADRYGVVTVADVNDLVGLISTFTDNKWGWTGKVMSRIVINRVSDGYELVFPNTESLK